MKVSVLYSQHITEDTSSSQQHTEQVCGPLTFCYEKNQHEYSFHFFNQGLSEHTIYVTEEVLMVKTKGAARQCQLMPTLGLNKPQLEVYNIIIRYNKLCNAVFMYYTAFLLFYNYAFIFLMILKLNAKFSIF